MTPFDRKMELIYRLLEEMTSLGRRLDELQDKVSDHWGVIETLEAENSWYRQVLEAMPQRFFLKDEHLRYVICSRMFASDLNRTVDEVIGSVEESLVPAELAKHRRQQEMKILKTGEAEDAEEILIINGRQKVFITVKEPLKDNGHILGIFGVAVDITAYWCRLVELDNLNRQMETLLAGQSQQISTLQNNLEFVLAGMRKQEEVFGELKDEYERNQSLKDLELERLRNELKQHSERKRVAREVLIKITDLRDFIASAQYYLDSLREAP